MVFSVTLCLSVERFFALFCFALTSCNYPTVPARDQALGKVTPL